MSANYVTPLGKVSIYHLFKNFYIELAKASPSIKILKNTIYLYFFTHLFIF